MTEPHAKSKKTYDEIAQWEPCSVLYSFTVKWSRWGLLGVVADYVLFHTQGCIVEIGVGDSSIFFTKLSEKYGREIYHCDISHGVIENFKTVNGYFRKTAHLYIGSSDDFFHDIVIPPIALGFIDGGHKYEQVKRDFDNMFKRLVNNGFIFIHDTYPPHEEWVRPNYCGDGYKLRQELEKREDVDCFTWVRGAIGVGLTMVRKKPPDLPYYRK